MQISFHQSEQDSTGTIDKDDAPEQESSSGDYFQRASFRPESHAIRTVEQLRQFINLNNDAIFDRVHALCYQSTERAEEVVQELYPRLVRFLESHPDGLNQPWAAIYRVARHLAVDNHRRAVRQRHESLPDDDLLAGRCQDHDTAGDDEERNARIEAAVRTLVPRSANIINGLFFDGRRNKDVAADLGLSESRLSELKSDALTDLRMFLTQPGI